MEDFLWKEKFLCSVVVECYPVEETSALTSKYIIQKQQKQKARKKKR